MARQRSSRTNGRSVALSRFRIAFLLLLLCCSFALQAQTCPERTWDDTYNAACFVCEVNGGVCNLSCNLEYLGVDPVALAACQQRCADSYNACLAALPPAPPPAPSRPSPISLPTIPPGGCLEGGWACGLTFVDPVPDLLAVNDLTTSPWDLANYGTQVWAVAADSAARVVLRIPVSTVGQVVTVTVLDENQGAEPKANIGMLTSIGGAENDVTVQVVASPTDGGPMAFAVYHPPEDFVRAGNADDAVSGWRKIQFSVSSGNLSYSSELVLLRPPVVLVHGLGDSQGLWDGFLDGDTRFTTTKVNYNIPVVVTSTDRVPPYPDWALRKANANQLGVEYNAPTVLERTAWAINDFRNGNNAWKVKAAAAQADVVAHSMGGLLARWAQRLPKYVDGTSFGQGKIHKLIAVATPHYGSNWAALMLSDPCFQGLYAKLGQTTFGQTVTLQSGGTATGALWDLWGNANGDVSGLFPDPNHPPVHPLGNLNLQALYNSQGRGAPAALIAGRALPSKNYPGLSVSNILAVTGSAGLCFSGPMWSKLTPPGWPTIFNNTDNDAIVSVLSQLAGATPGGGSATLESGVIHTSSLTKLGFIGPAEIVPNSAIHADVILYLNGSCSGVFKKL